MGITRISDKVTGDVLAFGQDVDVEAVRAAALKNVPMDSVEEFLDQVFAVEENLDPRDLDDDEWAQLVVACLAQSGSYREGLVTVTMLRPPVPSGTTPDWPVDHGGVRVCADNQEDREQVWRHVGSWGELRLEVLEAEREALARQRAEQVRVRATLAPVADAAQAVAAAEAALEEARGALTVAIVAASAAGRTDVQIAEAARLSKQRVGVLRKAATATT